MEENSVQCLSGKKKKNYSRVLVSVHNLWHVLLILYVDSAVMPLFCHFVQYVILFTALNNMFPYEMFLWLYWTGYEISKYSLFRSSVCILDLPIIVDRQTDRQTDVETWSLIAITNKAILKH